MLSEEEEAVLLNFKYLCKHFKVYLTYLMNTPEGNRDVACEEPNYHAFKVAVARLVYYG